MLRDAATLTALAAAAVVFYVAPWPALYLPALAVVAVLSWWRLDLALLLVILFCPAFMLPKHLGSKEFLPSEIFLALDVAVWVIRIALRRDSLSTANLRRSPFLLPAGLFLLAAVISTAAAVDHAEAFRSARETVIEPLIFLALLLLVQRDLYRWRWTLGAVILAGVGAAVISLFQLGLNQDLTMVAGSSLPRVKALYGSPDNLGLLLDRSIPLWLGVVLVGRLRGWPAVATWLAGPLLAVTLFYTFSRGAWVAIGLAALLILALLGRRSRLLAAVIVIVLIVAAAASGSKIAGLLNSGHSQTVERRLDIWTSSIHMIRDHPLLGVGPDNFLQYYAPVNQAYSPCRGRGYMLPSASQEPCLSHPHDEFLDFWLSTGILGLLAFLWIEVIFWREAIKLWLHRLPPVTPWLLGAMGAMLASLAHGLVDNSYFLEDLSIMFWVLCGFVSFLSTSDMAKSRTAAMPARDPATGRASAS